MTGLWIAMVIVGAFLYGWAVGTPGSQAIASGMGGLLFGFGGMRLWLERA